MCSFYGHSFANEMRNMYHHSALSELSVGGWRIGIRRFEPECIKPSLTEGTSKTAIDSKKFF